MLPGRLRFGKLQPLLGVCFHVVARRRRACVGSCRAGAPKRRGAALCTSRLAGCAPVQLSLG
eukprot:5761271-Prymnesium_polylepis.1